MPFRVMHSIPYGNNSSSFSITDLRLISSFPRRKSRRLPPAQIPKSLSSIRAKRIVVRWLARNKRSRGAVWLPADATLVPLGRPSLQGGTSRASGAHEVPPGGRNLLTGGSRAEVGSKWSEERAADGADAAGSRRLLRREDSCFFQIRAQFRKIGVLVSRSRQLAVYRFEFQGKNK